MAALASLIYGIVLTILPDFLNRLINSLVLGVSLAGYVQVMFLNKNLDLMGLNADGYRATTSALVIDTLIWIVIIAVTVFVSLKYKNALLNGFVTFGLLFIQFVALISLLTTADESCFKYPNAEYHLSGAEQYTLSENENIVVFILDCFSNLELDTVAELYPDCIIPFKDFTRYNNGDCVYFGTFPSLTHMFTNNLVDFNLTVNDWQKESWSSDKCTYFYDELAKKDMKVNFYTNELTVLTGGNNPEEIIGGKIANFNNDPLAREIDYNTLTKGMIKMSGYRLFPDIIKNNFYAQASDYQDVVKIAEYQINHENYDFKEGLESKGLKTSDCTGMLTVQHLMGTHVFQNDIFGNRKDDASAEETAFGCLYVVDEYLQEMKRLGLYDDATIIITADHGSAYGQVPVFLIKRPGDINDEMKLNTAPVSHMDFLGTLAEVAGIDPTPIGTTIYDFNEGDQRERYFYLRDNLDEYPRVPCYTGDKEGGSNVYLKFTYTGTEDDLKALYFDGYNEVIPMVDCYY